MDGILIHVTTPAPETMNLSPHLFTPVVLLRWRWKLVKRVKGVCKGAYFEVCLSLVLLSWIITHQMTSAHHF
jgi:hypothetical protein